MTFLRCAEDPTGNAAECEFAGPFGYTRLCRFPHEESHMATNLALDPKLLDQVLELSGGLTKKAAVTLVPKEFIARREQKKVAELFGKLDWDSSYDYKAERSRQ